MDESYTTRAIHESLELAEARIGRLIAALEKAGARESIYDLADAVRESIAEAKSLANLDRETPCRDGNIS